VSLSHNRVAKSCLEKQDRCCLQHYRKK